MDAYPSTPTHRFAKASLLVLLVLVTFAGDCHRHKHRHTDRSVEVEERRQRSVTEDPAFRGELPFDWLHGDPNPGTEPANQEEVAEFLKTFEKSTAPKVVQVELQPGATKSAELQLAGPSYLSGLAQWIGTASALKVTITVNGSTLVTGTATSTGKKRGESSLQAQTPVGGHSALIITNTSNTKIKVRLLLVATAL
jgi:hypothetical protein